MVGLDGSEFEHSAIQRRITEFDDRQVRDGAKERSRQQKEREGNLESLVHLWDESGIDDLFTELKEELGETWMDSYTYPIVRVASFPGFDIVPRPVRLGARVINCSTTFDNESIGIDSLHGKILFYRTVETKEGEYHKDRTEVFHDAGFYCFLINKIDAQTGRAVPSLVYGDLDVAKWPSNGLKLKIAQDILMKQQDDSTESIVDKLRRRTEGRTRLQEGDAALNSLLGVVNKRRWTLRKDQLPGVLRQNEQIYLASDTQTLLVELMTAMQEFINRYYKPGITQSHIEQTALQKAHIARIEHDVSEGIALSHFDVAKASLKSESEAKRVVRHKRPKVQDISTRSKNVSYYGKHDRDYSDALATEEAFPLVKAVENIFMTPSDSECQYALRDLLLYKKGEVLRRALSVDDLSLEQLKLCRSKMGRFDIFSKQKADKIISEFED